MRLRTTLLAAAAVGIAAVTVLAGCASGSSPASSGSAAPAGPVKIGVVGASDPYWQTYKQAAADAGITVEYVDFTQYSEPNPALTNGDLDLNQFQHLVYLGNYNVASGGDLVPIGSTAIYPLGLYSQKYTTVADIPAGSTVALPDDDSNLARGLLVLQSAGLVTLKDGGSAFSKVADIDASKSKVTVTTVDPSLTASSLPDVAASIINNDFLENAGLKASDAIAQDDTSSPNALQYVNVFAARAADANNPTYLKLVEIYQNTQAVLDGVQERSGGTAKFLQTPVSELNSVLDKVEADVKAHKG